MKDILVIILFFLLVAMGPGSHMDNHGKSMSPFEIEKLDNRLAPDFSLPDLNGNSVSLSSFRGNVVLLNFWATWCPPCKSEMSSLNRLYNEMKPSGLEVIAVSTDKSINDVLKYVSGRGFDFTILIDKENRVLKQYKAFSLPTTFLIDRNGMIIEKFIGEYNWNSSDIKDRITKL